MPVVTTTTSTGSAMIFRVDSSSAASSTCGTTPERGRDADAGSTAYERTAQLVGTTLGGDQDPATGKDRAELGHGGAPCSRPTSTWSSTTRTGQTGRLSPGSVRHSPVARSNTCLYIGEATVLR